MTLTFVSVIKREAVAGEGGLMLCDGCGLKKDVSDFFRDGWCNKCEIRKQTIWGEDWKKKNKARATMKRALRKGKIKKPLFCEICGNFTLPKNNRDYERRRLEGHHWKGYDVEYAIDVIWCCNRCHNIIEGKDPTLISRLLKLTRS